jgi:RNA polymerase sigma-70 factor (ECF subfamily)
MVGDMADAQDIVQTAFIKAFEKLSSFDEKYKFFSWIYRIMVNESLKHLDRSKQAGKLEIEVSSETKSPDEQYRVTLLREKIQDALMKLKPLHRTVIVLRYFADLSYRELAFVFDLPEKTIKSRLYSARQLLGNIVEAEGIRAHD